MDRRKAELLYIFYVVSAYWIVSISLVFVNKWLLSSRTESFDAPLFITWFQCATTAILCHVTSHLAYIVPSRVQFPQLDFTLSTAIDVLPLSVVFVSMVTFNNLCLKHLNVSFYYVARSLTTVFNVIFTYAILKVRTSRKALLCCAVIMFGYGSGVNIEGSLGSLSVLGACFGIGSSVTCALNSIMTAKCLPKLDGSVWRLTFYNNINAVVLLIPAVLLTETTALRNSVEIFNPWSWCVMLLSGLLGFAIGYVSALQIQVTSPLTHNVSGTAKAAAQTVLAVAIFQEVKSPSWWLSNLIVLLGSAAYAYVRQKESAVRQNCRSSVDGQSDDVNSSVRTSNKLPTPMTKLSVV
ncbi:GDP-L-fucose transporter [Fasciola gigantica]|uniref:GDP-L-fucose transporter n=1 Tax=Fasciola gigantica TaxID=46835 RepID=A0A504YTZ3_FASGI|nr:GDP-L-fucose transporter [Fasciola gigantica]